MIWLKNYFSFYKLCLLLLISQTYIPKAHTTFIAPRDLPSLISLIFSNIPAINHGIDSRFGFGYRLGKHMDFQLIFELGPQNATEPIGEPINNNIGQKQFRNKKMAMELSPLEKTAADWLQRWSSSSNTTSNAS